MVETLKKATLAFKALWDKDSERKLYQTNAESNLAEATKLLQELPAKLERDIALSKAQTEAVIAQVQRDGQTAILHIQRQNAKRECDLEFLIANSKVELGEK